MAGSLKGNLIAASNIMFGRQRSNRNRRTPGIRLKSVFQVNTQANTLVLAILSYLKEKGISVSKTKLLKLIYLFDVEFFRRHRVLFTGFDWKFYHLGPWTSEFDQVLATLLKEQSISEIPFSAREFDGVTLTSEKEVPLHSAVDNGLDESFLVRILNDWGSESTGRLLDHVYFHTEPMEFGTRNERLDFSVIRQEPAPKYKRSASTLTAGLIAKRKREYAAKLSERRSKSSYTTRHITPPRYDRDFLAAIETMERLQTS